MADISTSTAVSLLALIGNRHTSVSKEDNLIADLDSMVFDDTIDGTPVAFNQGSTVAAGKNITGAGAFLVGVATGAFNLQLKMGDDVGAQKVSFVDSSLVEVAYIDSDGNGLVNGAWGVLGNLRVLGPRTFIESANLAMGANYAVLGSGYTTVVARTGGIPVVVFPTATTTTTVGAGVFIAGVFGLSDPTVTTAGLATFTASDIVQVNSQNNRGIYEVVSHVAGLLTVRSTSFGVTSQVEDWTQNQFISETDTAAIITKTAYAVIRAGTDGVWETGFGSVTPLVFSDLASSVASGWTDDGMVVRLTTATDKVTLGSVLSGGKLFIDGMEDELQFQVDGHTTQTGSVGRFTHSALASLAAALEVRLDALVFTGRPRALKVDFASAASISNDLDVYGAEFLGKTNAGAGDSVGSFFDSGWDLAIRMDSSGLVADDETWYFGSSFDFSLGWRTILDSNYEMDVMEMAGAPLNLSIGVTQGISATFAKTAGGTITKGDLLARDSSTGKYVRCKADSVTVSIKRPVGMAMHDAVMDDNLLIHSLDGTIFIVNSNLSAATQGDKVYNSDTAGQVSTIPSSTTGSEVWFIGTVDIGDVAGIGAVRLCIQFVEVA